MASGLLPNVPDKYLRTSGHGGPVNVWGDDSNTSRIHIKDLTPHLPNAVSKRHGPALLSHTFHFVL